MKIGTSVFLFMLVLIALGYLISDSSNLRQELQNIQAENKNLKSINTQLATQLDEAQQNAAALQAERDALYTTVEQHSQYLTDLNQKNNSLVAEVSHLQKLNAELQTQIRNPAEIQVACEPGPSFAQRQNLFLASGLLLPTLLMGIPAVIYYKRHKQPSKQTLTSYMLLTKAEMHQIARQRRR